MFRALTYPISLLVRSDELRGPHRVQPCGGRQMLALHVALPGLARAVAETLAIPAHEEINGVLRARLAVSDFVLSEESAGLDEKPAIPGSLYRPLKLLSGSKLNHFFFTLNSLPCYCLPARQLLYSN